MTDVYSSLLKQYGKVDITDNGTYEVSSNGAKIIVPQNLSRDAYVVSYTPGFGDASMVAPNRQYINQYFTDNHMDNAILVIASTCNSNTNYSEMGYDALQALGRNTEGVITTGFSYSAPSSINEAAAFSKNHTDIPTMCISVDGTSPEHHLYYENATSDAYSGINPTGTGDNFSIVIVDGQFDHLRQTANYSKAGITTYNLTNDNSYEDWSDNIPNCHEAASIDVMQFIVPYVLGKKDVVDSKKGYYLRDANGNTIDMSFLRANLNIESSNSNKGNTTNIADNKTTEAPTPSDEDKTIEEDSYQSVIKKYSELANLSELKILNMSNASSNYISSDLQYVCDSMNNVRNIIKNSDSYSNIKQMDVKVPDGIFGIISDYINRYMDIVSNLYNKLSLETEAIVSYAQYIVDVDNSLKEKALAPIKDDPVKPLVPSPIYYGGGKDPNKDNYEKAPVDKPKTLEYHYDDGHKMFVEVDGDKVVKITYQYHMNNVDEYDEFVKKIYSSFENPDIIEKVFLDGNVIKVILKDSYCATLTLNDVNNMAKEV